MEKDDNSSVFKEKKGTDEERKVAEQGQSSMDIEHSEERSEEATAAELLTDVPTHTAFETTHISGLLSIWKDKYYDERLLYCSWKSCSFKENKDMKLFLTYDTF